VTVEYEAIPTHQLTTGVTGSHGTLNPPSGPQYEGTVVGLTAAPDAGYQVKAWTGTDNDAAKGNSNAVTLSGDKVVTVEFEAVASPSPGPCAFSAGSLPPLTLVALMLLLVRAKQTNRR
jgi:hypothetical protein